MASRDDGGLLLGIAVPDDPLDSGIRQAWAVREQPALGGLGGAWREKRHHGLAVAEGQVTALDLDLLTATAPRRAPV